MATPQKIERYGYRWDARTPALAIELQMIRNGGGSEGLFFHYKQAQILAWPDDDHHRWSELMLRRFLENEITVIMGSADSGKSYGTAKFVLIDWWAFPNNTLWLLSSTELRGAELRIWGAIKQLFNRGREQHPWLPGTVLESKHAITTEEISDDGSEARLLTKGLIFVPCRVGSSWVGLGPWIGVKPVRDGKLEGRLGHVGDECFPAGTMVGTPSGNRPIESIEVGDKVWCASGEGTVIRTIRNNAKRIAKISTRDGRAIFCTPEHRFFTQNGWEKACELNENSFILSQYEAMSILRSNVPTHFERQVLRGMPREGSEKILQVLQRAIYKEAIFKDRLLLPKLRHRVEHARPGIQSAGLFSGTQREDCCNTILETWSNGIDSPMLHQNDAEVSFGTHDGGQEADRKRHKCSTESSWAQTESSWRERNWSDKSRMATHAHVSRRGMELRCENWKVERKRHTSSLQSGHRFSRCETWNRSRWVFPWNHGSQGKGCKEGGVLEGAWVDSVEIFEQADSGFPMPDSDSCGCSVYNLEVAEHPSYSVEGLLVHNCSLMVPSFLSAYSNWYGKPNFKGILQGNPADLEDPLCVAGEPVDGWDNWHDEGTTQEWKSKFYGAHVIALDGRDSPNNDFPELIKPRYPYLVGKKKLEAVAKTHGVDSWQYFNQCVGKPRAMGAVKRVITRQLCENNHAFEDVIWEGSETTKVGFMDAAYGGVGGDRCIAGHLEFGRDVEGKSVIAIHPLVTVPVSVRNLDTPELQIARFVMQYCIGLDIPAENFFFDGRGTLAVELARVWSPQVNVVDFGGTASKRPVSMEEYIWDGDNNTRRLKRCDEHYSKFVTELWFSVYYLIVGHQVRQLPREAASEGYKREWYYTKGNRIEVEPKAEMKKRTNQSPDLMDAVVAGIEGARRLGFVIENMRDDRKENTTENPFWLEQELAKHRETMQKHELSYRQ